MSRCPVDCHATLALPGDILRYLAALPDPVHVLEESLWCELERRHDGPHCSLGQTSRAGDYFVYWSDSGWVEVKREVLCPFAYEEDDDQEICGLPAGHAGRHSFDFEERYR